MRRKFHIRPTPPKKGIWRRALSILIDKESRTTGVWLSSGFGLLMISCYYMWLGFTPAFSMGQGTLLLLQAFLAGGMLTAYFTVTLLFPAWTYQVLEIHIEDFPREMQQSVIGSLFLRSIAAQTFSVSLFFLVTLAAFSRLNLLGADAMLFSGALVIFGISLAVLLRLARLSAFGQPESAWGYIGSLVALGFSGLVGAVILFMIYEFPGEKYKASGWFFLLCLVIIIIVSGGVSTLRKKDRWLTWPMGAFAFIVVLVLCNAGTFPFKGTAVVLGIAVPRPVEIELPPSTCTLVQKALTQQGTLACDGVNAGRLQGVHLLNTLGERWVVREEGRDENIIFEGKGAVIKKLPRPARAES